MSWFRRKKNQRLVIRIGDVYELEERFVTLRVRLTSMSMRIDGGGSIDLRFEPVPQER